MGIKSCSTNHLHSLKKFFFRLHTELNSSSHLAGKSQFFLHKWKGIIYKLGGNWCFLVIDDKVCYLWNYHDIWKRHTPFQKKHQLPPSPITNATKLHYCVTFSATSYCSGWMFSICYSKERIRCKYRKKCTTWATQTSVTKIRPSLTVTVCLCTYTIEHCF